MAGDDRLDVDPHDDDAFGSGADEPRLAGSERIDAPLRTDDDDLAVFGGGSVHKGLVSPSVVAKPRFVNAPLNAKEEISSTQAGIGMKESDGGAAPPGNEQRPSSSSVDGNDDSGDDGNVSTDPGGEEQSLVDPVDPFLDDDLGRHDDVLDAGVGDGADSWVADEPDPDADLTGDDFVG